MKKFVVMMLVVMVLTMGMSALGELSYRVDENVETNVIGVDHKGNEVTELIYYAYAISESGSKTRIEVSKDEYDKILEAQKKEVKRQADSAKPPMAKVASFITFWNPND